MGMEDASPDDSTKIKSPGKVKDGDWVQWELEPVEPLFIIPFAKTFLPVISLQTLLKLWFIVSAPGIA